MQHHYVVMFDTETNEFSIDYDSASVRFLDCTVYDPQSETWSSAYSHDKLNKLDTEISDRLSELVSPNLYN